MTQLPACCRSMTRCGISQQQQRSSTLRIETGSFNCTKFVQCTGLSTMLSHKWYGPLHFLVRSHNLHTQMFLKMLNAARQSLSHSSAKDQLPSGAGLAAELATDLTACVACMLSGPNFAAPA